MACPAGNRAEHHDVGQHPVRRLRGVASCEADRKSGGKFQQSRDEAIHPFLRELGGKRQGKKRGARNAAHRGDVAQSASQATVPYGVRRMPLAAKVHAFQAEVGGDQRFVPARNRQNRAVVADASARDVPRAPRLLVAMRWISNFR